MRRMAAGLLLPVALLLSACAEPGTSSDQASARFEIRPVLEVAPDLGIDCTSTAPADPGAQIEACDPVTGEQFRLDAATVDGHDIASAETGLVPGVGAETWAVFVTLDAEGVAAFAETTRRLTGYPPGSPRNRLALVIDGRVISAPSVMAEIADGRPMITGGFTEQEARELADRLATA